MTINIFNNEPDEYSSKAVEILKTVGDYYESVSNIPIHILITRLKHKIDKKFLAQYPHLQYILTATTGLDHIDLDECSSRDIHVISLNGEYDFLSSIVATSEHTIALMLSLLRNIPRAILDVQNSHWSRMQFKGHELKNKTICILGMGRLGTQVAKMASAFQMNIQGFDYKQVSTFNVTKDLTKALTGSDILSIHLPYNSSTKKLVGLPEILCLKPNSYIINTSRGQILDEKAVIESLEKKHLAGVAVDVLENEYNLKNNALWNYANTHSNVIITPHISGCTYESMEATEIFIANKFKALINLKTN
ncbi:MAG TPA: hypothetical protein DEZ08_05000 [Dehalococcoidia bacterium]|jgi:D-3-phosphoglycerate dehydrogenase / 2-oxoglutarate reductase|nr:hypothetical protein [Dehalococcoidia bacterium]|tara:strand:- start:1289 stop:2206 length:918 start_codon:yes stop_codon:yes gene_type:complete